MDLRRIPTPDIPSRELNSHELDVHCWQKLCSDLSPATILELGTGEGLFLSSVMPLLPESKAVTINAPLQEKTEGNYTTFKVPSPEKIGRRFRGHECEKRIQQVFCLTKNMLEVLGNEKFDLIHVDASHDKNDVIADSINSLKVLNVGGVIVWHDFHPNRPQPWIRDVYDAIEYLHANGHVKSLCWFERSWICYSKLEDMKQ